MIGVNPICGPQAFTTSSGGPGYYTPFNDSSEGWSQAREFIDWYCRETGCVLGVRSGFHEANKLARLQWDMFKIWYATQKLLGE